MKKSIHKVKSFSVGLCIAGTAALVTTMHPLSRGSCAGLCAQCGGCGLTAIPLVLWLAAKKWGPETKIRSLFRRTISHSQPIRSALISPEDKVI